MKNLLFKMFVRILKKEHSLDLTVTEINLIKRHFDGMKEEIITVHNWRDSYIDQGHEPEINIAEEIFGTPQDTENLDLQTMGLDGNTAAWTYMALEWLHSEQEEIKQ